MATRQHPDEVLDRKRQALEYSAELFEAARMLAVENGLLCGRDGKSMGFVAALEEENARLKGALNESVEHVETVLTENNTLHQEISNLTYRLRALERAMEALTKATPAEEVINQL